MKEGRPAGWQQIDGLRIAIWRGQSKNGCLRLKLLKATQHDIALILPSAAGEVGVDRMVQNVVQMLEELGLGSDAIEPSAVNLNSLADRRVVILAHNPNLSDHCTDALVQYVQRGGKLLVCYLLPRKLGDVLGFGSPTYYRPPRAGRW